MSAIAGRELQREDDAGNGGVMMSSWSGAIVESGGGPRRERLLVFAIAALVLIVAILTITPWPVGAFQDDAIYTVLAKALASGEGFRLSNLPGSPYNTHYPPGYPLVLAALWKLWPSFPDNIVLFKFANAFFLSAAAVGTYALCRTRWKMRAWQASLVALVGTISVVVLLITGVVLSEPLFLALLFPTLLAGERAADTGDVRWAIVAGLLIGALAMVRTLGAFALPAAALVLLARGHWRALIALGIAAALFLVPWQLWVAAHQGEIAHPLVGKYGSYGAWLAEGYREGGWAFARAAIVRNAQDIGSTINFMILPVPQLLPRGIVFSAMLVFLAAGTKRFARNAPVTLGFLAIYTVVVMLWPFEPNRFLIAVWPLWFPLAAFGAVACWRLALPRAVQLPWRAAVAGCALAMSAGYLWYNGIGYTNKWWAAVQRNAGQRARPTVEWVARHTSPTDILATEDDLIVYLYTGRKALPTSTFTAAERLRPITAAQDSAVVRELFAAYDPDYFIVGGALGLQSARALVERAAPELRPVGRTSHVTIFKRLRR